MESLERSITIGALANAMERLMVTALLILALVSPALADTTRCTTREDAQAKRWVTTCTDGARAITRWNAGLQR